LWNFVLSIDYTTFRILSNAQVAAHAVTSDIEFVAVWRGATVPTDPPTGTAVPTDPPTGTAAPTDPPTGTAAPTEPPTGTASPTDPSTGTAVPTDPSTGTAAPTHPSTGTLDPSQPSSPGQTETPSQPEADRPSLPQTGVVVGFSILGGSALLVSGLAIASKKRKS